MISIICKEVFRNQSHEIHYSYRKQQNRCSFHHGGSVLMCFPIIMISHIKTIFKCLKLS